MQKRSPGLAFVTSLSLITIAPPLFAAAADPNTCLPSLASDWMSNVAASAASIRPADCTIVQQTPPDFGWPDIGNDATYQVTLIYSDGRTKVQLAPQNWLNWPETLPPGNYSWQVTATTGSGSQISQARRFIVQPGATEFVVPDVATLLARITAKPHPRALPDAESIAAIGRQRAQGINILLAEAAGKVGVPPQSEPASDSLGASLSEIHDECQRTIRAAVAWIATRDPRYGYDALNRLNNLASWNPNGKTSYQAPGMDMGAREIAWTMALTYDWLYPDLDAGTRSRVLQAVETRTGQMFNDVVGSRSRIAAKPRDSHGYLTLNVVAAIATLIAGDSPSAATWLVALPQAANMISPWGDDDSGHANGTTQGSWDLGDSLVPWYIYRYAAGVDVAKKAWVKNWSNFMAYMMPPGTPAGSFGDGAERNMAENWSRFGQAQTFFAPTPLGRWYISQPQLRDGDGSRLETLLAPPADFEGTQNFPQGIANSALFQGVGWAAMHSDLADPSRISFYFKSSPYGSFNHGHADQNSFVINAGGQKLAIDSGYYDDYKTPHWAAWYKQTKAHNAITYDGGKGQLVYEIDDLNGVGRITLHRTGPGYEIIQGDASQAYGPAVSTAQRTFVHLPPNLALVYDNLGAPVARTWEWNIHALQQMSAETNRRVVIQNNGQRLCIDMLAAPELVFSQTDQFDVNPIGAWSPQWHGRFSLVTPQTTAEFIALLNVGCTPVQMSTVRSGTAWTVTVNGQTVTIDAGNVSVAPR